MLKIVPVPAFQDNYIWLLCGSRHAAVVDPGDAKPVREFLQREGLELCAILATHHHPDHVGGIAELAAERRVPVFGPRAEPIPAVTAAVAEGDAVTIPELDATFSVLDIPGHTRAHIAYYRPGTLFCGDTLFACGCGRLFEGTPEQMYASLQKLAALPEETRVYCAHEYTLANIRFALAVEPDNAALQARAASAQATRARHEPTVPSTIALELATNPFLRCSEPSIRAAAQRRGGSADLDRVQTFAAIRAWKDGFR
jgi:hydroxyacylglutathione hydrolase